MQPGQIHFLRLRKIASRDEPVNNRDLRPRSITVLGELITTRRTWPIIDAMIASNGSIATPAVVSHRRELFCVVRLVAGSWLTHRRRPRTRVLCRVGGVGSIDVRLPRPAASHQSDHTHRAHVEIVVACRIGVGRSLSSGDNIRCLDRQRSDLTVRWHLVGDRRAGDEPDTDIITPATETSTSRSS